MPDRPRRRRRGRSCAAAALVALAAAVLGPASGSAQARLTQREALRMAFPEPAEIERETAFLDDSTLARARELAGEDAGPDQGLVTYYVGRREGRPLGVAYFDAHEVRTMREVLMVVVSPAGRVERVEVLSFKEPPEYLAPDRWLRQFEGRALEDGLTRDGEIVSLTGATLTARAVSRAVRRVLALHRVIDPLADGREGGGSPGAAPSRDGGAPEGSGDAAAGGRP